jgi:hypothetical protein
MAALKALEGPPGPDEGRNYGASGYAWALKKGGKKAFLQKMAEAAKVRDQSWRHRALNRRPRHCV